MSLSKEVFKSLIKLDSIKICHGCWGTGKYHGIYTNKGTKPISIKVIEHCDPCGDSGIMNENMDRSYSLVRYRVYFKNAILPCKCEHIFPE